MTELVARLPQATIGRLRAHARMPLHRDAYALVANSGFTAITGLLYWIVAAKTFSAHAVGLNSALISSMMFLAGVAGLNLPNIVVRFLPEAGRNTGRLIATCYAVVAAIGAVAATIFVAGAGTWAHDLHFLASTGPLAVWFVVATVAWTLFTIQDGVLTGLGRAVWVPLENAGFSVAKLGLLVAGAALLPRYGIFVSWTVSVALAVVVVNALVFGRLVRGHRAPRNSVSLSLREPGLRRYLVADYAGATAWLASVNLLPVVVTAAAGATTNAYFALAWAVAFPLYAVGANVGTSLVLHGASDRDALPALARKALVQGAMVLVPAVAALVLLAPLLLSLFGGEYADHGTTLLRLLAFGALPNLVLALGVSIARVERRMRSAVIALTAHAAISLGLVVPLLHATGVVGPGLAWVASQCVVAVGILVLTGGARRFGLAAEAEDLRGRAGTILSGAWLRNARGARLARAILADVPAASATWDTWAARTDSDVVVRFAGPRPDARLVVKVAWSEAGARALAAHCRALAALRSHPELDGLGAALPEMVASGVTGGRAWVVERALPGGDARRWARDGADRALAATAEGVAALHFATGETRTIDDALIRALVDDRLATLAAARGEDGLGALRADLHHELDGRHALIARSHGDLWLGNALLAPDALALTGLVDWEASREHDLPGIDVAHLVISTRSIVQGSSLGGVMRRLLSGQEPLTALEAKLLAPYTPAGGPSTRALVLLAWLQHVAQRLTQTSLHTQTRWLRRTVDPVLAGLSD